MTPQRSTGLSAITRGSRRPAWA